MKKTALVLAAVCLLFSGVTHAASDPASAPLLGSWLVRTQQFELSVDFTADGRYSRTTRTIQGTGSARGAWKLDGSTLEMRTDGDDETLRFTVKMPDARTLELWEGPENGVRLIRQGDAPAAAPQSSAPATAAPAPAARPPWAKPQVATTPQGTPPPAPAPRTGSGDRPACPKGWAEFQHPLIGMQAYVPPDYWVRLRGGVMLTVEKQESPGTMAFLMPFRPKPGVAAADIARHFARFIAESEPRFHAEITGQPTTDRAVSKFTSVASGQPVEGRYCTLLGAGGTMAFVIGISAPQGRLAAETATLETIAQGFGFTPPRGRWMEYRSPAGGFTMTLPQGWQVQSGDGQSSKDNIDWVAFDPEKPLSRAFQWCPRYCSPAFLQDPLHVIRGYQAAQFQNHQQVVTASLGQISKNVQIVKMDVNQQLTPLFKRLIQQTSQLLGAVAGAQMDVVVYDCLARAEVEGRPVTVAFFTCIQTLSMNGGYSGPLVDLGVTLRGWCAEPAQFVPDSPVLEKVCSSMELTAAFLRNIMKGNDQAVNKIRETYAYMNKVDDQIRDSHWKTMDAIAEMNYDNLRDHGGYVNESTGRIEQMDPAKVVKNSRGEIVSREEIERGVSPESATVLRDAFSNDYMKGVYGRIQF